ncbi:MAG: HD domain-containing phosphohydrolase [Sphaerochaetaceae bacterium]
MVVDIVYNIALLLAVSVIFSTFPLKTDVLTKRSQILLGVIVGLLGILIMSRPAFFSSGVTFDSRTILIGVTAMFFGPITGGIGSLFIIVYRLYLGGGGVWTGMLSTLVAFGGGSVWHHTRYRKGNYKLYEFYLVGLFIHLGFTLTWFALPIELQGMLFHMYLIPILIIYPAGFFALARLLHTQIQRQIAIKQLEISRKWFKTLFEEAPVGITVTDTNTGEVIEVNRRYLEIIGRTRSEMEELPWQQMTYFEDLPRDLAFTNQMRLGEIDNFEMEKRFVKRDGSLIWTQMAVSRLFPVSGTHEQHLCMIADISERKAYEEAIIWANSHDQLTKLYNRTEFDRLLMSLNRVMYYPLTVAIGDINGLKIINDAFGSEAGDDVLKKIAQTIETVVGSHGRCARLGGDEFGIILPNCTNEQAWELINKIQESPRKTSYNVELSISFGVATKIHKESSLDELLKLAENSMNQSKVSESPSSRSKAVTAIINTLHEKNKREESHSRRVSSLAADLAKAVGMNSKEVAEVRTIGLLHDIGKIGIDEQILNKSGTLNDVEWSEIKRHPEIGWRILTTAGEMGEYASVVLSHHERMDGKGYPRGIQGEAIPLYARLIAVVDAFDAMTAERTYKKTISELEAAKEIKRCSGTQFDPLLACSFISKVLLLNWEEL